jgi:hypothetical protein
LPCNTRLYYITRTIMLHKRPSGNCGDAMPLAPVILDQVLASRNRDPHPNPPLFKGREHTEFVAPG